MRKFFGTLIILLVIAVFYFAFWPVSIEPVAWKAPPNPGYVGEFAPNERLKNMELLSIGEASGPEDIAIDSKGFIYAATHEGYIVRLRADGSNPEKWADTEGRPLGIDFDCKGNLIVADAFRGLLSISPDGVVSELATEADGIQIKYANNVDVAANGDIYFSDSSIKFGARENGGTYPASLLDINEHGGHGRLLVHRPATGETKTLLKNINFANGVAVSHDQTYVLLNETGSYRVLRYWIADPHKGRLEICADNLPSFPDNISTGLDGRFWIALVSPRNKIIDKLSGNPFARKMIQRLPGFMRPKAVPYGHIVAIDGDGNVLKNLQDPAGGYPVNSAAVETKDFIYIGSLIAPNIGRLSKRKIGF